MSERFDGCRALVTGAASGIGRAVAGALVAQGARVAAIDIAKAGLDAAREDLGPALVPLVADVTDEDQVQRAVTATVEVFGGLDAAFNVAGAGRLGPIIGLDVADWNFVVDLVQKGVFLCTKHEARAMIDAGARGSIVNVASLNARIPMPWGSSYATAKAGVEMFSKNAALELAGNGIRVNAVLPGLVTTPATAPLLGVDGLEADFLRRIPMRRPADPAEVAAPCLFLASADAGYITGASLTVDGGWATSGYPDLSRYLA